MLSIDHAMRRFHEAHVLLVKKAPTLNDLKEAQAHALQGLMILRHATALISLGIYELAPVPPPPGEPLFETGGTPAVDAMLGAALPGSDDAHLTRQRYECAREILALFEESRDEDDRSEIMAREMMDLLSKSWSRDKIVRPVLKSLEAAGILSCKGNTNGAVYTRIQAQITD